MEIIVPSKTLTPDYQNYTLVVSGNAGTESRQATLTVPLIDSEGDQVDFRSQTLGGDAFDQFWETFNSDKDILRLLFPGADVSSVPDSIINQMN